MSSPYRNNMKIKGKETIYDGFYTFRKIYLEDKGETLEREQFDSGGAVAALVYDTKKKEYILVRQFRYSVEQEVLEVVGGVLEDDPEENIRKEIAEETGYEVDYLEPIWNFYTSPGACTEAIYLYYAEVSQKIAAGGGKDEEHEQISISRFTEEELLSQPLRDAKTIIAIQWLAARLGKRSDNAAFIHKKP
ncbi:NUDIX domain-containing protein [Pontibacter litorisediminis]|uniref:NUDIX domain-containing protein n=1 Tax=Pontibacter litorisediminis TaxID=1846260 RepID=UPI0023ED3BA6|nr:NUDIX hydrolase [Pontibacter litorisediminis]